MKFALFLSLFVGIVAQANAKRQWPIVVFETKEKDKLVDVNFDSEIDYKISSKGNKVLTYFGEKFSRMSSVEKMHEKAIFSEYKKIEGKWVLIEKKTLSYSFNKQTKIQIEKRIAPDRYKTIISFVNDFDFSNQSLWNRLGYQALKQETFSICLPDQIASWGDRPQELFDSLEKTVDKYITSMEDYVEFPGCTDAEAAELLAGIETGLSCINGMGNDGAKMTAQLLGIILKTDELTGGAKQKMTMRCGDFLSNAGEMANYPAETGTFGIAKNACAGGFPEVGINTNATTRARNKPLGPLAFHEMLHLTGMTHGDGLVDKTYMCEYACFDQDLNANLPGHIGEDYDKQSDFWDKTDQYCSGTKEIAGASPRHDLEYMQTLRDVVLTSTGTVGAIVDKLVLDPSVSELEAYFNSLGVLNRNDKMAASLANPDFITAVLIAYPEDDDKYKSLVSAYVTSEQGDGKVLTQEVVDLVREGRALIKSGNVDEQVQGFHKTNIAMNKLKERVAALGGGNVAQQNVDVFKRSISLFHSNQCVTVHHGLRNGSSADRTKIEKACTGESLPSP